MLVQNNEYSNKEESKQERSRVNVFSFGSITPEFYQQSGIMPEHPKAIGTGLLFEDPANQDREILVLQRKQKKKTSTQSATEQEYYLENPDHNKSAEFR